MTFSETAPAPSPADQHNYVLGVQTISPSYRLTTLDSLTETARGIRDLGCTNIKLKLGSDYPKTYPGVAPVDDVRSLSDLITRVPAMRGVFDMPFRNYVLWMYPFSGGPWDHGLSVADAQAEYREVYSFARLLLTRYNGTGKRFYLGHWEGDWLLHAGYDPNREPAPDTVRGMIQWLNNRQKAVDDAKQAVPHHDVDVFVYTEVNLVQKAMQGGTTVTNSVLPKTNVDYVSYSCYDSQQGDGEVLRACLRKALDYIESRVPPKAGVPGKRVFIGEFGFPSASVGPAKQAAQSVQVLRASLEWGCPFAFYWEFYNNEVKDGRQLGFWLIDDKGAKQPVYDAFAAYLKQSRAYVDKVARDTGKVPSDDTFRRYALGVLEQR